MKSLFSLSLVLMVTSAYATSFDIKPGLWKLDMNIESGGKKIDPMAEVKKAMANMTPEQRKQMEAAMGRTLQDSGTSVCYTQELLNQQNGLVPENDEQNCKTDVKTKTAGKFAADFKCEDGATGTMEFNRASKEKFNGLVRVTKEGALSKIVYEGKFVSADCGSVSPVPASKR